MSLKSIYCTFNTSHCASTTLPKMDFSLLYATFILLARESFCTSLGYMSFTHAQRDGQLFQSNQHENT